MMLDQASYDLDCYYNRQEQREAETSQWEWNDVSIARFIFLARTGDQECRDALIEVASDSLFIALELIYNKGLSESSMMTFVQGAVEGEIKNLDPEDFPQVFDGLNG